MTFAPGSDGAKAESNAPLARGEGCFSKAAGFTPPIIAARNIKKRPRKTSPLPARPPPPANPLQALTESRPQPSRKASRPKRRRRKASLDRFHTALYTNGSERRAVLV